MSRKMIEFGLWFSVLQIVFVPIIKKGGDEAAVLSAVDQLAAAAKAAGIRIKVDADQTKSPGFRFNYWELKVRQSHKGPLSARLIICSAEQKHVWRCLMVS